MSKWRLLKNALLGVENNASDKNASIHRHEGFSEMIPKTTKPWTTRKYVPLSGKSTLDDVLESLRNFFSENPDGEAVLYASGNAVARHAQVVCDLQKDTITAFRVVSMKTSSHLKSGRSVPRMEATLRVDQVDSQVPAATDGVVKSKPTGLMAPPEYDRIELATPGFGTPLTARIRRPGKVSIGDLFSHQRLGVDNTGNVRVWASEEILLLYAVRHVDMFKGARVLELGAGMTGLAGMGVAACTEAAEVVLTDGNQDAVDNLRVCVAENVEAGAFGATRVSAARLLWGTDDPFNLDVGTTGTSTASNSARAAAAAAAAGRGFDIIIASDCLFFTQFHTELSALLAQLLAPPPSMAGTTTAGEASTPTTTSGATDPAHSEELGGGETMSGGEESNPEHNQQSNQQSKLEKNLPPPPPPPAMASAPKPKQPPQVLLLQPNRGGSMDAFKRKLASYTGAGAGAQAQAQARATDSSSSSSNSSSSTTTSCSSSSSSSCGGAGGGDGNKKAEDARSFSFQVEEEVRYDEDVWRLHQKFLQESSGGEEEGVVGDGGAAEKGGVARETYNPDIHFPVLLRLTAAACGGSSSVGAADVGGDKVKEMSP